MSNCAFGNLPKPLTTQEIEHYFIQYKNGDLSARDILIKSNIRLVSKIARQYISPNYDINDLIQIGCIGLVRAIDSFDINKNFKLSTYLTACIENEIKVSFRRDNKHINNISLEEPAYTDKDGNDKTIEDTLRDEKINLMDDCEHKEQISILRNLIDEIPKGEREIIILHFGFDGNRPHTQSELAEMYHFSKARISRILKKNVNLLRNKLYKIGIIETTRQYAGKYNDNITKKISGMKQIILQLEKIHNHFQGYPKTQLSQALQIYISDLSPVCSKIMSLVFDTNQEYKPKELSIKFNCCQWTIYDSIKKLNQKLKSKSSFEELSVILSKMTSEVKYVKINEQPMEQHIINESLSNTDNHTFITDFQLLEDGVGTDKDDASQNIDDTLIDDDEHKEQIMILKEQSISFNPTEIRNNKPVIEENISQKEEGTKMKPSKTLYEIISNYSETEVNNAIANLNEHDKSLIALKYGNDLHNPTPSTDLTKQANHDFYSVVLPKLKKILSNPSYQPRQRKKTTAPISEVTSTSTNLIEAKSSAEKLVTSEEYIKALEFFNNPLFEEVLKDKNLKEKFILSLVLGQLDKEKPKYYSTEAIAEFLDMNIEEVREIVTDGLLAYKDILSSYIDTTIINVTKPKSIGI